MVRQMVFRLSHQARARQDNQGALWSGHAGRTGTAGKEAVAGPDQRSHRAKWGTAQDTCRGGRGGAPRPGRGANVAACELARFHFIDVAHVAMNRELACTVP